MLLKKKKKKKKKKRREKCSPILETEIYLYYNCFGKPTQVSLSWTNKWQNADLT